VSCKESKKVDAVNNSSKETVETKSAEKVDLKNKLRIYIDGVIKNDVQPKIIFADDFVTDKVISNKTVGRPKMKQRLSFIFPEFSIPYYFNIVFDNDCVIDLEHIVINMNDNRIIIKDSAFHEYFDFSKTLKLENNTLFISKSDTLKSSSILNERIKNRYLNYKNNNEN
jgi:hypothetical protein